MSRNSLLVVAVVFTAICLAPAQIWLSTVPLSGCNPPKQGFIIPCSVGNDPNNTPGEYWAVDGKDYQMMPLGVVQGIGVSSFNGRTGAVIPQPNDYSYNQLANPPTKVANCAAGSAITGNFAINKDGTITITLTAPLTLSGCTIQ